LQNGKGQSRKQAMPSTVTDTSPQPADTRALVRWLWLVAGIVVAIVAVGGITRLTESGLSITEWKPVTGVLPPLSEAQWQAEFAAYRRIPQYLEVNGPAGMSLADYKFIYFWEWVHRLLARLAGLAFALPLAWFWIRNRIPSGYRPRLLALLALGGLQGVAGWWMVTSGLSPDAADRVSHYRLGVHLVLALITLGGLVWTALDLEAHGRGRHPSRLVPFAGTVLAALFVQLVLGAFLAGMRAGHVASDWPLMQGSFFPEGVDWSRGILPALADDPYLVHFTHRWWAWAVAGLLIIMARRIRKQKRAASIAIHTAFGTQIVLGIATVMTGIALWLAVLHQLCGALLVAATVWGAHVMGRSG